MKPENVPQIEAVIFDMDGLMIDSERTTYDGYREFIQNRNNSDFTVEQYIECLGKPEKGIHQVFYDLYGEDFPAPAAMKYTQERMAQIFEEKGVPLKEGLVELLKDLHRQNIKCAVATSSVRARVDKILKRAGLEDAFDAIVCGNEVEHGKPAPDIFLKAASKLGVSSEHCLVLEDSESGIQAAAAGNIPVFCIPDMKYPEEKYAKLCTLILPSLNDVAALIQNSTDKAELNIPEQYPE